MSERTGANLLHTNGSDQGPPRTQAEAEEALAAPPLTLDYRPGWGGALAGLVGDGGEGRFDDHWAHLRDVERMLTHPNVGLPYSWYKSGIADVKFTVKAADESQAEEAHKILTRIWERHLDQLQLCYDYGWCGYEVAYEVEGGRVGFDALIDLLPLDCWALTVRGSYRGFRLKGTMGRIGSGSPHAGAIDLWGPGKWPAKGLWLAHDRRWDRWYGRSQLRGAWRPWKRLAGRDGAEDVIDGAVYRRGYQGPEIRYPAEDFKKRGGEMDYEAARNEAMLISQQAKAGFSVALPGSRDSQNEYKWQINWPTSDLGNLSGLLEYEGNLQKAISIGVGVPPELLEASETGSGWSGRKVPLQGFYTTQRKNARNLVRSLVEQIVLPILKWNHGDDAWCEVEVDLVLPEAIANEPPEQAGPGGAMPPGAPPGGGPGGPPPPDGGQGGGPPDLGPLDALLPGGGAQLSLGGDGDDDGWLDPGEYPPDDVDAWSVPVGGWEMAAPQPGRYVQRQITRGPRKGQTGWYDGVGKKFMPANWAPKAQQPAPKPAPARKAAPQKQPAAKAAPVRAAAPAPKPAPPKAPAAAPAKAAPAPAPLADPAKAAQLKRIQDAAKKDMAAPDHPINRYKSRLATADFGSGEVKTLRSTKDAPLSRADHEAMDRAHSRTAAALKLAGDEQGARAQLDAARFHRGLAERKGQQQSPPPQQPAPPPAPPKPAAPPPKPAEPEHLRGLPEHAKRPMAELHRHLDASKVSPAHKREYAAAAGRVFSQMTPAAAERFSKHLAAASFSEDLVGVEHSIADVLDRKGDARQAAAYRSRGGTVGGAYNTGSRQLFLDGGHGEELRRTDDAYRSMAKMLGIPVAREQQSFLTHETYAHEFAHVIDGPGCEISESDEWWSAYNKEIVGYADEWALDKAAAAPLTEYARTSPQEGFAELGRMILAGGDSARRAAKNYPRCYAVWAKRGLAPTVGVQMAADEGEGGPDHGRIVEIFSHRDALPQLGGKSHADRLRDEFRRGGGEGEGRELSRAYTLAADDAGREPREADPHGADAALDAVATPARRACREARRAFLAAVGSVPRELAPAAARRWAAEWQPRLAEVFAQAGLAGSLEGMRDLAGLLADAPPLLTDPADWASGPESAADWPLVREAAASLAGRGLLSLPAYLSAKQSAEASGMVAAQQQVEAAERRLRDALLRSVEEGGTLADFRRDVSASLGGTALEPADAETVFRTNVMAAYSDGQERLLAEPGVGELFPYVLYSATHDGRTRPEHLAMEKHGIGGGPVYRRDDPVFQSFRPPWDHNCRCVAIPLSVAGAARRGVAEAVEWERTGRPPARPAWVEPPPFRPDPRFAAERGLVTLSAAEEVEAPAPADPVGEILRLVEGGEDE